MEHGEIDDFKAECLALGLDTDAGDTDLCGFCLLPARAYWGLADVPVHLKRPEWGTEEVSWEAARPCG